MRDARNVRNEEDFVLETTPEEALMAELGLTPEEYEAAVAQITFDAENLDVFAVLNIDEDLPCIATFSEYQEWHTSVGLTTDENVDYQLYVALCQAKDDNWIPTTQPVQQEETNNTLLKTGLLLGGAYLVFNAFNKK